MDFDSLSLLIDQAIESRLANRASFQTLSGNRHDEAFRLFNGFYEGFPDLVLDIYGQTLVIYIHTDQVDASLTQRIYSHVKSKIDWLVTGVVKTKYDSRQSEQNTQHENLPFGGKPDRKIREDGIWYAVNLMVNRDASFYLDTRNLRKWLVENSHGKTVLNTFAYTGSLGVAARAGGAKEVVQTDHNRTFLNLAKDSYSLNGFSIQSRNFISSDFFSVVARFKGEKRLFDTVILDPPFFSVTPRGKVDMFQESERLINKVRPLVADGGNLIAINNAVFLRGADYMNTLEGICAEGYLSIRELIPVPDDFIGYNRIGKPIADPTPFNHSTKVAILDVRRKR